MRDLSSEAARRAASLQTQGLTGRDRFLSQRGEIRRVQLRWDREWSADVAQAFAAMPYDPLMDPDYVRRLWEDGVGRDRQKIAVLRASSGEAVGVIPLRKRGLLSWQFLTQYVMPYARFFIRPEYTDAALAALGREVDCDNVSFYQLPAQTQMLRPEESWIVALPATYEELMRRTKYGQKDRLYRRQTAEMELREDDYSLIPEAMTLWQEKWLAADSPATAQRKDDLMLGFQILAEQKRLKTFSLHDGEKLVAMEIEMVVADKIYSMTKISRDEYREKHVGIRLTLAAMEWGCAQGKTEFDMMRSSANFKRQWAEPKIVGYRLVRSPYGSELLGSAMEGTKEYLRRRRSLQQQRPM